MKKMIKESFGKVILGFNKKARSLYISVLKISNKSDYKRWSNTESLFSAWDERTKLLSENILPDSTVFEFGAAKLVLKTYLPENCKYLHSDIVSRDKDTIVIDLNKDLPVLPQSDYTVFSGVLEYVNDVENVLAHCSGFTNVILFSYATVDVFSNIETRRFNGWVSDLSQKDIEKIALKLQMELKVITHWKSQTLYMMTKK